MVDEEIKNNIFRYRKESKKSQEYVAEKLHISLNSYRKIEKGKVYIGDEAVIKTKLADQNVYVGIRPEGFIYDEKGVLTLNVDHVEVMGRDKTVVSQHPSSTKPTVRSILDSDVKLPENAKVYKFNIKPNKLFLFNAESEERIL